MKTSYASFIAAILGMNHWMPHHKRVIINPFGAPSIYHAWAIREHNTLTVNYYKLSGLICALNQK